MKNKNEKNIVIGILVLVVCFMAVGYAALSTSIHVNGNATLNANSWNVYINNISLNKSESIGTYNADEQGKITLSGTTASFNAVLSNPGSSIVYDISIKNTGSINAIRSKFDTTNPTTLNVMGDYLSFIKVTLVPVEATNELIATTGVHNYKLTIKYNDITDSSIVIPAELDYTITANFNYIQA